MAFTLRPSLAAIAEMKSATSLGIFLIVMVFM